MNKLYLFVCVLFLSIFCLPGKATAMTLSTEKPVVTAEPTEKPLTTGTPIPTSKPIDGILTEEEVDEFTFSFRNKEAAVIVNDTISLGIDANISGEYIDVEYTLDNNIAGLDIAYNDKTDIRIKGYNAGTAKLTANATVRSLDEFGIVNNTKTIHASIQIIVLPTISEDVYIGDTITLDYMKYDSYKDMQYDFSNKMIITLSESGVVTATNTGYTSVYIFNEYKRLYIGTIRIKDYDEPYMNITSISRAIGSVPYAITVSGTASGQVSWSSSNPGVAVVDQSGNVSAVSVGQADIIATVTYPSGRSKTCTCIVTVTDPQLNIVSTNLAKGCDVELVLQGTTGSASWSSTNTKIATVYGYGTNAEITGIKKGKVTIQVQIDGVIRTCNVTVTNPTIKKTFYVVSKGLRQIIKVKGTNSSSNVTFKSSKSSVATVSDKGIVKAKKKGYAAIYVEVDHKTFVVSINIASKKAVKAVNNAFKAVGSVYSQARRMQKGYYDCSSLVWRTYSPVGVNFGNRYYAPVAASEAQYLVNKKMTISKKSWKKLDKMQPGDLIFFTGKSNGRYKNIYHVAIYVGQDSGYFGGTYGRIVHASGQYVTEGYIYNTSNIVVIGRPFK